MSATTTRSEAKQSPGRMDFRYLCHMALAMVRANPRSIRTFISVSVATLLLLLSFAAINGMATLMSQSARDVISGDVSAFAEEYEYSMLNPRSDVVYYLEDQAELAVNLRDSGIVDAVRPRLSAGAQLSTASADAGALLIGADFAAEGYTLLEGTEPTAEGEICITQPQSEDLDIAVGDAVTLAVAGAPLGSPPIAASVSCVYDAGRFGLFRSTHALMPLSEVQRLLDRPDAVTQMLLTLSPGTEAQAAVQQLTDRYPGVRFASSEETADLIFTIQTAQRAVMWGLVVVTALICAVLIGNIVRFALRRERGEIATMRTMGFNAGSLRMIYVMQTLLIGGVMVTIGAIVAIVSVWIVGAVGIPIGRGEQLFGDNTLRPWLGVADVVFTALLTIAGLVIANVLAISRMLQRPPIEILRTA